MNNNKILTPKERKKLFEKQIAKRFLSVLTLKGAKEWKGPSMAPFNGVTKKKYRGLNHFMLALVTMTYGYDDPRWYTFNQIADYKEIYHKGSKWHLKKGSEGILVEFYFPYDTKENKNLTWAEYHKLVKNDRDPKDFFLKARYFTVFNAAQIDGIEPYAEQLSTYNSQPNEKVLELADKMGVKVAYDGGDRAFYRSSEDTIHLPKAEHFFSSLAWAATTLHELGHASGAAHRLNRIGVAHPLLRTIEDYAYEELVAEISSCLMCYSIGIEESEENISNHEAYVVSWIKKINEKPEALTNAIKEAQKAVDYMTNLLAPNDSPPDDSEEVLLNAS